MKSGDGDVVGSDRADKNITPSPHGMVPYKGKVETYVSDLEITGPKKYMQRANMVNSQNKLRVIFYITYFPTICLYLKPS